MADVSVLYEGNDPGGVKKHSLNLIAFGQLSGKIQLREAPVVGTFRHGRLHNELGPAWEEKDMRAWALEGEVLAVERGFRKWAAEDLKSGKLTEVANINFQALGFTRVTLEGQPPGTRNFVVYNGGKR
jgi:hypothetical protein